MINDYNPFKKKWKEETPHGMINYEHSMGTTYVTHRRKEHYFKKYQGFGISNTELEIAYNKRAHWVMIIYHTQEGPTEIYRIKMNNTPYLEKYTYKEDEQTIFPTRLMEQRTETEWK